MKWVDAICAPVLTRSDLAKLALIEEQTIDLMTTAHAGAWCVLLLDDGITEIPE